MTTLRVRFRTLLPVALAWLLVASFLAIMFWPALPSTWLQWLLFILFGPPLYLLGEEFFGWLFSPRHGAAISNSRFSFKRILIALLVVSSFLAGSLFLMWLFHRVAA